MASDGRAILIEGHTDSVGGDNRNMSLAQRRADAVRSYIVSRGYPTEKIRAQGTKAVASS